MFHYFDKLPAEIRVLIWQHALSSWTVWSVEAGVGNFFRSPTRVLTRKPLAMEFNGPNPHAVGFACTEAFGVMSDLVGEPTTVDGDPATGTRAYWVDMERTVINLSDSFGMIAAMDELHRADISRFKHVVIHWHRDHSLRRACGQLANMCPKLETVIAQRVSDSMDALARPRLTPQRAGYYISVAQGLAPEQDFEPADDREAKQIAAGKFIRSVPRIFFLPPERPQVNWFVERCLK
ncbi:hypothetical protein B0I35DRAFT_475549 [Stachybotrys elegans]|uniref:2EXR domain-containing protein n=1 Tax=Stachybotrys elegans TaxID=80388 RepID=A0A8K0SWX7_9HYPO|nr:hypothetical protein B0I35DRAFT_475549 [Stachybotrys elegans]